MKLKNKSVWLNVALWSIVLVLALTSCGGGSMGQDVKMSFTVELDRPNLTITNITDTDPENGNNLGYNRFTVIINGNKYFLDEGEELSINVNGALEIYITTSGCEVAKEDRILLPGTLENWASDSWTYTCTGAEVNFR